MNTNIIKAFKNESYLIFDSSLENHKCKILVRNVNVITKELLKIKYANKK